MCGRYLLRNAPEDTTFPWRDYWKNLNIVFTPRYNIAPSQAAVLIGYNKSGLCPMHMPWGFKPSWSSYQPMINARAEGLLDSKMFRNATLNKRCLIPSDGFYEPEGKKGEKNRPWHLIENQDQSAFYFAGIWTESGYCIITTEANQDVAPIHSRMPLILDYEHQNVWLDYKLANDADIDKILKSKTTLKLVSKKVKDTVKNPRNEGEQCIDAAEEQNQPKLI